MATDAIPIHGNFGACRRRNECPFGCIKRVARARFSKPAFQRESHASLLRIHKDFVLNTIYIHQQIVKGLGGLAHGLSPVL